MKNADVAVALVPKDQDAVRHEELVRQRAEEAASEGKRFPSYRKRLQYAQDEVKGFLKGRSRALSLYDLEDWVMTRPHKVILGSDG